MPSPFAHASRLLGSFLHEPLGRHGRRSLFHDVRGGTIEKIIVIGVFVFGIVAGVRALGTSVDGALHCQAGTVASIAANGTVTCLGTGAASGGSASGGGTSTGADPTGAAGQGPIACTGDGCMCFTAGTPVMTSEGPRAIETIRPGTLVLARDQFGGATDWKPVLQTFVSRTQSLIHMEVRQQDGTEDLLEVTPNHPFFVEGRGWIEAGTLVPGQDLLLDYRGQRVDITSATSVAAQVVVYNLEVADYHTYFAGRLGIWAHNVGYQPCNVPPSIQAVMDQTGSGLFFPAYPPLPPSTGSTGSSVGGYLPAPPNWPLSRPPSAVPTPVGTPTASPYLTPFSSPWSSSQYLTAPPSPWSSTSSFGAPPPAPAPAPAPITQLAPGTFLYHATKWESLNNIVAGGLRPVPNAWGGGQLGPGFYTATTAAGAHSYLTEAGGILVYQTIGPTQGPRVDLWQNPLPPGHPAFDQFPFFAGTENPITQYKWNHSAYNRIELVGVKFGPNEDMIPIQDYRDDYLP